MNWNPFNLFAKKKQMAIKMPQVKATTAPAVTAPPKPDYNRGFNAYKDRLDEALNY